MGFSLLGPILNHRTNNKHLTNLDCVKYFDTQPQGTRSAQLEVRIHSFHRQT